MQEEKVDVQEEVVEQEEITTTEVAEETETTEENEEVKEETVVISKSKLKAMQHKAIAYDALKKVNPEPKKDINNSNSPQLADELKLIAKGVSEEVIEKAKIVSKGLGISLQEAMKDPLVVTFEKEIKEVERKQKARLGVSSGSGVSEPKEVITSGMTREEHEKVWKEAMGK